MVTSLFPSRRRILAVATLALCALGAFALGARADGPEDLLYPPELIQKFGRQAGLSDEQMQKIRKDFVATRGQMIDIEAKLQHLRLDIEGLLGDDAVPIEQILAKVEAVGAAETEMKKLQVGLMVRIRRMLTPEQRKRLDELRPRMPRPPEHDAMGPRPPHPGDGPRPPEPPQPPEPPRPPDGRPRPDAPR